jgi:hypothetical protein
MAAQGCEGESWLHAHEEVEAQDGLGRWLRARVVETVEGIAGDIITVDFETERAACARTQGHTVPHDATTVQYKSGDVFEELLYDPELNPSTDPNWLMGMKIEVRFAETKFGAPGGFTYYPGEITRYPGSGDCWRRTTQPSLFKGKEVPKGKVCHYVRFEDGDTSEYMMCSKNFNILHMPRRRIALGARPPQLRPAGENEVAPGDQQHIRPPGPGCVGARED